MRSIRRPSARRASALALAGATLAATATAGLCVPANAAVPAPPQLLTAYTMVNIYTNPGTWVDYKHRVAYCSADVGGTCTITKAQALATNVQVDFGLSKSWVSGKLGFSLSQTNSTSVSCQSGKMKAGQVYAGYRVGTRKSYRIQKWQGASGHPLQLVSTSAYLEAFQPDSNANIHCRLE